MHHLQATLIPDLPLKNFLFRTVCFLRGIKTNQQNSFDKDWPNEAFAPQTNLRSKLTLNRYASLFSCWKKNIMASSVWFRKKRCRSSESLLWAMSQVT